MLWIEGPLQLQGTRKFSGEFVESGDQPGAARRFGTFAGRRGRGLTPADAVQQAGRIAAETAQQCFSRCAFHPKLVNSAQHAAITIHELEVKDLCLAVDVAGPPLSVAVEPPGHAIAQ